MVIGIIGESCTGKSTLADQLKSVLGAEIYTGKDYLRLAKNETAAQELFQKKLEEAMSAGNILYVISEEEHLELLPENAVRILMTADLEVIKKRFSARMHGNLPIPVAAMLEKKHGCFDSVKYDIHIESDHYNFDEVCTTLQGLIENKG